ncbi:NTP transferase domain-containing protein [Flammeovirga sp. EKP202]|uniref:NTP transferase domain-containing protein n=1 Tax=Flammeovirga sp. EKP202 TaxID=2770592 RepID=UPI00165EEBA7|nr:NTP transferase domain-containing protein [Flammeovirga sp. EKP202]MBD0403593.1 NTP transferase domain-containing protein [Flammeovirga sp. EKP202]
MKRQKKAKIAQREIGNYGINEIAIMGVDNNAIREFVVNVFRELPSLKIALLDQRVDKEQASFIRGEIFGNNDHSGLKKFDVSVSTSAFELKTYFRDCAVTFVNGNYFTGQQQLLFIDSRTSLIDQIEDIKNPIGVVFTEGSKAIPTELLTVKPELADLPTFTVSDLEGIASSILSHVEIQPQLKGLVLVGGKSTRMGEDKAMLDYHGKPQWKYSYDLLSQYCDEVFVSVANKEDKYTEVEQLEDKFLGLGPLGGILSAFQSDPNSAWLVVACDLPLLSANSINQLVQSRNPQKLATTFKSPAMKFPEPLICIWEPKAYGKLLEFLSWGYSSPLKTLVNNDIELVIPTYKEEMTNANTPEEYQRLKGLL